MQLVLNEFFEKYSPSFMKVSSSAWSKARQKLSHRAFITLNQQAVVEVFYSDSAFETWKGHRLLGIDGSKILLPDTPAIREEFGTVEVRNQHAHVSETLPMAQASVCYDVLNHIALDSCLTHCRSYEGDLALAHLQSSQPEDLHLLDRGYASFWIFAQMLQGQRHFVIRCSKGSFKEVQRLCQRPVPSRIVTLSAPSRQRAKLRQAGLPLSLRLRFVTVLLKTGEVEVLATSLLDEVRYPATDFGPLYYKRWGVETFYGIIKGRLSLENFTGKTPEAVKQDFYATILLSGMESLLTSEAQEQLDQKTLRNRYPQQVNKAVSFNTIKNHVFELFSTVDDLDILLAQLTQLFLTNPVVQRTDRQVQRRKTSALKRLRHHQRFKKICF